MLQLTIIYKDNSTRVLRPSNEFLVTESTLSKGKRITVTYTEKCMSFAYSTGIPYKVTLIGEASKVLFERVIDENRPFIGDFITRVITPNELKEKKELRNLHKNDKFTQKYNLEQLKYLSSNVKAV